MSAATMADSLIKDFGLSGAKKLADRLQKHGDHLPADLRNMVDEVRRMSLLEKVLKKEIPK